MLKLTQLNGFNAGLNKYSPNAISFIGPEALQNVPPSNTSAYPGVPASSTGILSFWFRLDGSDATNMNMYNYNVISNIGGGQSSGFNIQRETSNKIIVSYSLFQNPTGTSQYTMLSTATYVSSSTWHHALLSWNVGFNAGSRIGNLYIDDINQNNPTDSGDANFPIIIDYATPEAWGQNTFSGTGGSQFNGSMSEIYFAPNQFLDFSIAANRRKFINSELKPVYLGIHGQLPTGTAPAVYLNQKAAFAGVNQGSGQNFSAFGTGSIVDASTVP